MTPSEEPHSAWLSDGEGRNRTADTTIFSRVLYQLSYLAAAAKASASSVTVVGSTGLAGDRLQNLHGAVDRRQRAHGLRDALGVATVRVLREDILHVTRQLR